jgi:hypothetical protein
MTEMRDGTIYLSKEGALNVVKELLHPNTEAMKKRNKSIAEAKNYTYLKKLIYKIKIRRGKENK